MPGWASRRLRLQAMDELNQHYAHSARTVEPVSPGSAGVICAPWMPRAEEASCPTSLSAIVVDCRDSLTQANWWATVLRHQRSERDPNEYEVNDRSSGGKMIEARMRVILASPCR